MWIPGTWDTENLDTEESMTHSPMNDNERNLKTSDDLQILKVLNCYKLHFV